MKKEEKVKSRKGVAIEFCGYLLLYLLYFRIVDFLFLDLRITSEIWSISLIIFCSLLLAYITLGKPKQVRLIQSN